MLIKMKKPRLLIGEAGYGGFPFRPADDNWFAMDTEGTGLDVYGHIGVDRETHPARPFMYTFCNSDGETAWTRFQVDPFTREVIIDNEIFDILSELLENKDWSKIFHNASYDCSSIREQGLKIKGPIHDTMIGMHCSDSMEKNLGLKYLDVKYLGGNNNDEKALHDSVRLFRKRVSTARSRIAKHPHLVTSEDLIINRYAIAEGGASAFKADFWLGDPELCKEYGIEDAVRTAKLRLAQIERFEEDKSNGGRIGDVYNREIKVCREVMRMERRGVCLDDEKLYELTDFYSGHYQNAEKNIKKIAGEDFNPNSDKQKHKMFFQNRGHKPKSWSKKKAKHNPCGGSGCEICGYQGINPVCDGEYLLSIAGHKEEDPKDPEKSIFKIDDELAYWCLFEQASRHMLSTFIDVYDELKVVENGVHVLHPNFKTVGTKTGRLSATRPNLMAVASDDSSKKKLEEVPYRPRECVIPRPGHTLLVPDYSQVEVWVFAHVSKDKKMQNMLYGGLDAHGQLAKAVWGDTWDDEAAEEAALMEANGIEPPSKLAKHYKTKKTARKRSKCIMFAKLYGARENRVAAMLGCSITDARKFIRDYDLAYPGVAKFMDQTIRLAKEIGSVESPFGRVYNIDPSKAYRAVNYLIQGSAADIFKNSIIRLGKLSRTPKYKGLYFPLLLIHDEFLIEAENSVFGSQCMLDTITAMQGDDHIVLGSEKPFPVGMKFATERWGMNPELTMEQVINYDKKAA